MAMLLCDGACASRNALGNTAASRLMAILPAIGFMMFGRIAISLLAAVFPSALLLAQAPSHRSIAITVDDLPAVSSGYLSAQDVLTLTAKLVGILHDQKIPAVGFVNEVKLYNTGEVDDRIRALNLWLENGLELGNHTFAHTSLNRVPLQTWQEDVVRGE